MKHANLLSDERGEGVKRRIILDVQEHIVPKPDCHYIEHTFEVPPNVSKVGLRLNFDEKAGNVQLYISLHDPTGFRGHTQCPGPEAHALDLWVRPDNATEGALPGALPSGTWRAQVDCDVLHEETDYHVIAYVEFGPVAEPIDFTYPEDHVVEHEAGWYRGELHAHSSESDGRYAVETVVQAAIDAGLDFLSLTDHHTTSHWRKLARLIEHPIALLRSCEITAHRGHASLHGIHQWVDVYVDRPDWTMNHAATAVHEQGGLFCINHAFGGGTAWRYFNFDWRNADLMEIHTHLEGCNNDAQISLWDRLLSSGYRIVGVGGTDVHDPFHDHEQFGQVVTWVFADELSEKGILAGLRRGNIYVSRGPKLRFTASCENGETAGMWECLPQHGLPVTFHIDVLSQEPIRAFLIKNGFLLEQRLVFPGNPDEWQSRSLTDTPHERSFYRLELHSDTGIGGRRDYPEVYWRDYSTMRALSNPIWIGER